MLAHPVPAGIEPKECPRQEWPGWWTRVAKYGTMNLHGQLGVRMAIDLESAAFHVRGDLSAALHEVWGRLARPGTWWSGLERVAIAAETRHALDCEFCARCKQSLSPFSVEGSHEPSSSEPLPLSAVEAIHRIVNDSGRLTPGWFEQILDGGLDDCAYVEMAGVIAGVTAVDTFHRGLGLALPALPEPLAGEASRVVPDGARKKFAWVRTVSPKEATGALAADWFPGGERRYVPHVHQALSLVPSEAIGFRALCTATYLDATKMNDSETGRAITRPQIELVAARTAALNECFY